MTGCANRNHRLSGYSLVELFIAVSLFITVSSSLIALIYSGRSLISDSADAHRALLQAQEGIAAVTLLRDEDWSQLQVGTYGLTEQDGHWSLSETSDTEDIFTRQVVVAAPYANVREVTVTVSWDTVPARQLSLSLATVLTNWRETQENNYLDGDWRNPVSLGSGDVDSGVAGTDVVVGSQRAYLSGSSSQLAKEDLVLFDVANGATPTKLSSNDLAVGGLSSIAVSGTKIYGAIANSTKEYMIVDVANPAAPVVVNSYDFSNGRTQSVAVSGTTLYLGMEQIAGETEFYAIDVSDPNNPSILGSFEVGGTVASIGVFNQRVYLATSRDDAELMVLDVTNPAAIQSLGTFNVSGTSDGTSIFVKDEFNVYLGRAAAPSDKEFYILDASLPATITEKGSIDMATRINDMVVVNRLAFVITEEANAELRILDISNPTTIALHGKLNFPQAATGIAYENNTIYVAVRSNDALRIIGPGS